MARLGVLGWPVAHSRSPAMHTAALAQLGLGGWSYQRLPVPPELFDETVRGLPGAGFVGANVTIPHKEAALALADDATPAARTIGAANTLSFSPDGAIEADNTDAPGLLAAIGEDVAGMDATVLGAGGSARAAVFALREAGARVAIWNRSAARARQVAEELGATVVAAPQAGALLVNCTSVGLHDPARTFKDLPLDADGLDRWSMVVDLVYRPSGTALLDAAARRGCRTVDGLEVLVRQGALSLTRWTGREAPLAAMRTAARGPDTQPRDDA
nr:shikimate dehydrogenase [Conexibacter sp. SYSU D00693]